MLNDLETVIQVQCLLEKYLRLSPSIISCQKISRETRIPRYFARQQFTLSFVAASHIVAASQQDHVATSPQPTNCRISRLQPQLKQDTHSSNCNTLFAGYVCSRCQPVRSHHHPIVATQPNFGPDNHRKSDNTRQRH